ncbi:MAG: endonuclease/exonuclease/phosphatase family protein, partial [Verrucomicrobiota bacterium]
MKVTSWNVEHLDRLLGNNLTPVEEDRRDAVIEEIQRLNADILCILEGPKGEVAIDRVSTELLNGDWVPVKASDGYYNIRGRQWIWFLVKPKYFTKCSLLPVSTYDAFAGSKWPVNLWGQFEVKDHTHYRHPQVLILEIDGQRIEFIGLHLKSKYVNRGRSNWNAGGDKKQKFIREALTARIKLTTEAANVRNYINEKFSQVPNPAIFVLGDLNDGPGKEYFERQYLFFDLISNIQGSIFEANKFLNHALFDFPDELRWSVKFKDFIEPNRNPHILLDHILFTQGLSNGSLPFEIKPGA